MQTPVRLKLEERVLGEVEGGFGHRREPGRPQQPGLLLAQRRGPHDPQLAHVDRHVHELLVDVVAVVQDVLQLGMWSRWTGRPAGWRGRGCQNLGLGMAGRRMVLVGVVGLLMHLVLVLDVALRRVVGIRRVVHLLGLIAAVRPGSNVYIDVVGQLVVDILLCRGSIQRMVVSFQRMVVSIQRMMVFFQRMMVSFQRMMMSIQRMVMWQWWALVVVVVAVVALGAFSTAVVDWLRVRLLGQRSVVVLAAIGHGMDHGVQDWHVYVWDEMQMDHVVLLLGLPLARGELGRHQVAG